MRTRRWQTWLAWALVSSAVTLVCARVLLVQGTVFPARVASGSMAPTLMGVHRRYQCPACQYEFHCGSEAFSETNVVCPNCGDGSISATGSSTQKGTRVLLDRWRSQWQAPQRGDVVTIQRENAEDMLEIKRVAGLPGEAISIRQGDVFVDSERWRKSLAEYEQVAITVHDDRYRAAQKLPRWQGETGSRWQATSTGYQLPEGKPDTEQGDTLDWLTYHHRACIPNLVPPKPAGTDSMVVDYCAYNQALTRSHLAPVRDLMLSLQVHLEGKGRFLVATSPDRKGPRLELNTASRQAAIYQADKKLGSAPLPLLRMDPFQVDFGFFDGQVVLAINELELMRMPLSSESPFFRAATPFAIASTSDRVHVTELLITRDIYYLHPHDSQAAWQTERLGPAEFLLLGDNPPLSLDSRNWPRAGVPRKKIYSHVIYPGRTHR